MRPPAGGSRGGWSGRSAFVSFKPVLQRRPEVPFALITKHLPRDEGGNKARQSGDATLSNA
ncbi:hypothetical protein GCM10017643_43730 [Ancylobacter dichloromethanicus]|uniref:Uncharacterized protein n=1 Tax=Ancylobacter dichloromethanicus TaxID=518825 RepID=A0A9W6JEC1_9HYPH|nr:hypothetical protein GCM10017643_43730 [Ancylobacter dichloromethanicus]